MTNSLPSLSIVTPTRGNFPPPWRDALLAIRGDVEFILVYPPGKTMQAVADARVRALYSPLRGEVIQRLTGLLNARGRLVLALDDDDVAHPDLAAFAQAYFARFPESWVLRLRAENVEIQDAPKIARAWDALPPNAELARHTTESEIEYGLREIPIAPLQTPFRWRHLLPTAHRRDMHGAHMENFNNRVWRNEIVQPALGDLVQTLTLWGALKWIPTFNLDRLLGLYVQAYHFAPQIIIGHALDGPAQLRRTYRLHAPQEFRLYGTADALLVRRFPQYGYFWNLFFFKLYQESAASLRYLVTRRVP
jgi:glycosyltransferase involved in cell wall biosynthesis